MRRWVAVVAVLVFLADVVTLVARSVGQEYGGAARVYLDALVRKDYTTAYRATDLPIQPIPAGLASAIAEPFFVARVRPRPLLKYDVVSAIDGDLTVLLFYANASQRITMRVRDDRVTIPIAPMTFIVDGGTTPSLSIDGVPARTQPARGATFVQYRFLAIAGSHRVTVAGGPVTLAARGAAIAREGAAAPVITLRATTSALARATSAVEAALGNCSKHGCVIHPCPGVRGDDYALETGAETVLRAVLLTGSLARQSGATVPAGGWTISVPAIAPAINVAPGREGREAHLRARFAVGFVRGEPPAMRERCYERLV